MKIKGADGGDKPECVIMSFQIDLGAGVHVGELEQAQELVFGRALVVCDVRWAQDEPSFLPRLS